MAVEETGQLSYQNRTEPNLSSGKEIHTCFMCERRSYKIYKYVDFKYMYTYTAFSRNCAVIYTKVILIPDKFLYLKITKQDTANICH